MNFINKRITIMGIGLLGGGIGTAKFFAEQGARVLVTDLKSKEELTGSIEQLSPFSTIKYVLGKHREQDFIETDMVVRNPAVPQESAYLAIAREHGVPVEMAESLFLKEARERKITNIIGVTGTRGKSTTSAMIFDILKKAGKSTYIAGNVKDTSTLELLTNDNLTPDSYVVLELSSWQLESLGWHKISPHIAVITNIYPDHLNRYASMEQYIQAKSNIFLFQSSEDHVVLHEENEQTKLFAAKARSSVHWFSSKSVPDDVSISLSGGGAGGHNRENAGAAYIVCSILSIEQKIIKDALENFHGLPGRLEHLGLIHEVTVINDTTSTTPTSGIKAIESIQPDKGIVLVIGGNSKNLPLKELIAAIKKRVKAIVYLTGTGTDDVKDKIQDTPIPSAGPFESMQDTMTACFKFAEPGDVILFSPSFTSFGQFKNEFERGEVFHAAYNAAATNDKKTDSREQ
ncbi:UDP-N-acetylmuramoyl-L-alanine--D-glutamate ligase [Candidatus Roizmanbacteria bacterium]|nr:UDP-N-acetylmuramoyl-L-alanine--D-glutamate ligase [Candidatus Roizmanbacteria bacterium]